MAKEQTLTATANPPRPQNPTSPIGTGAPAASAPSPGSQNPPPTPGSLTWLEQAEAYLVENGWEKLGGNERGVGVWRDPVGSRAKAEPTTEIKLPSKNGGFDTYHQMTGPPVPWEYTTDEAYWIQRHRTAAGQETGGSPLERLDRVQKERDVYARDYALLLQAFDQFARTPLPTKQEEHQKARARFAAAVNQVRRPE